MKKVFLTGAAGFIGSHLVPLLLERGIRVTGYDNLATGRFSDIQPYLDGPNFRFITGDMIDAKKLKEAMYGHDTVWHLGANTLIPPGGDNRRLDLHNNTLATVIVLETMKELGITEMLFASTAAVYGDEPGVTFTEGYGPLHPISLYGASKLACEAFISAYAGLFGIHATMFRFSNVVGGGMGHGVTYDFIQKLLNTPHQLRIWGNGQGSKPYFTVEDCIRGMFIAHETPREKLWDTFNLGTDSATTVDQVGKIVCEEMGLKDVEFVHEGGRHGFPGDVPCVRYDIGKMAGIGWAPMLNSDDAIRFAARRMLDGRP